MAIVASDLVLRLSGGSGNTDPNAALGGAKSTTAVTNNVLNNFWDDTAGIESTPGDTEYRCGYLHNAHATLTAKSIKIWISSNTTSTASAVSIAIGSSAINGTEQTIADESTAPTGGVTFTQPTTDAGGLASADIPAGQHRSIWVKRVIDAAAPAKDDDTYILSCAVDTNE